MDEFDIACSVTMVPADAYNELSLNIILLLTHDGFLIFQSLYIFFYQGPKIALSAGYKDIFSGHKIPRQ